jgi:hypothetical protein
MATQAKEDQRSHRLRKYLSKICDACKIRFDHSACAGHGCHCENIDHIKQTVPA